MNTKKKTKKKMAEKEKVEDGSESMARSDAISVSPSLPPITREEFSKNMQEFHNNIREAMIEMAKAFNERLKKLENPEPKPPVQTAAPTTEPLPSPKPEIVPEVSPKSPMNPDVLTAVARLFGVGAEENQVDRMFREIGERVFMRTVDKFIPSKKEVRKTARRVGEDV